jgi:hypothetical protein
LALSPEKPIIVGKWRLSGRAPRGHFDKNGKINCVWTAKSYDK